MPRGGYRQPANPAPTSGPGMLSKRTDGGAVDGMSKPQPKAVYTGMPYGDNKEINDQQSGANIAGNGIPMVSLNAPTTRPDEPVTTGINMGAGGGTETRQLPNVSSSLIDTIKLLAQFDSSGDAELIYRQLTDDGY